MEEIDLGKGLTVAELDLLIGSRDHLRFLNPRNELYREKQMKQHPPTREQALLLMSKHPNLIRRPLLAGDGGIVIGLDEESYRQLIR